jgi:uncharacterized protein
LSALIFLDYNRAMPHFRANLIVFARPPHPRRAQRLPVPSADAERAAAIQRGMTGRTMLTCRAAVAGHAIKLTVCFAEGRRRRMRNWLGRGPDYVRQGQPNLGLRLQAAFAQTLGASDCRTVIVGADCPGLTPDIIHAAFDALSSHALVLGPATDGGYYLVGLSQPCPGLFDGNRSRGIEADFSEVDR